MAHPHWPLFDLRIRTPTLELASPSDDDLMTLVDVAVAGVHDPAEMPFETPWTDEPSPTLERRFLQFFWGERAGLTPARWRIPFAVRAPDDGLVGVQDAIAVDFPVLRQAETGSWLGQEFQGRGIGTEMRAAVLHLLFAGLGAERAITAAWEDNPSSLGVTRKLGYRPNGEVTGRRRDEAARQLRFEMTRTDWEQRRRDDIEIEGLEACLPLLGLA